jgi:broad specificity phosphatase PhoE
MQIYFARHGESVANLLNVFSNRDLPHGLTETGKEQVRILADKLQGTNWLAFYSSPILRARQSSDILGQKLGINYEVTEALREYDVGIWEGTSDRAGWQQYKEVAEEWLTGNWQARMDGGESFNDIRQRFVPLIEELKTKYSREDGAILLLGHGGTFRCMLPLILSNINANFVRQQPFSHTMVIIAELRGEELVCLRWGDLQV